MLDCDFSEYGVELDGFAVKCNIIVADELGHILTNYFGIKLEDFPKVLSLIGLRKGKYLLSRENDSKESYTIKMIRTDDHKELLFELKYDKVNPSSCTLIDSDSEKTFRIKSGIYIEYLYTLTPS